MLPVILSRLLLITGGKFSIYEDDNYCHFVDTIESRPRGAPLLTVSNHRSVFDDPGILSCVLPLRLALITRNIRFSVCAEEVCFQRHALLESFFSAGKTLPVFRGGGVNQPHLLDFARQAVAGEWLHIFPEGKVSQLNRLGGRESEDRKNLGALKWGVAKLIAHAPVRPVVIPFIHIGMDGVMPMDQDRKLLTKFPQLGQSVQVKFGPELSFDDLITEHEQQFGPLWRYSSETNLTSGNEALSQNGWNSASSDFTLYKKITDRVELALVKINDTFIVE